MAFANGGDRRRRVLTEQVIGTAVAGKVPAATESARQHGPRYVAQQSLAPLAGLVPMRRGTTALVMLLGLLAVGALLALHLSIEDLRPLVSDQHLDTFNLASRAGLGGSFSALTFLVATVWSLGIYTVRRHRTDDYKARYRIWIRLAIVNASAALCVASGVHRPAMDLVSHTLLPLGMQEILTWWFLPAALGFAYIGLRTILEITESKLSLAFLAITLSAWASALIVQPAWLGVSAKQMTLGSHGLLLLGQVFLLATLACYGRHVRRDAAGLITMGGRHKTKKARAASAEDFADKDNAESAARQEPARPSRRRKAKPAAKPAKKETTVADETTAASADDGGNWWETNAEDSAGRPKRKLSKSERRRLRKQQAQQQRAA